MKKDASRFFDEDSPQLDRFGPLLALTVFTVIALSLVDLRNQGDKSWPAVAASGLALFTGVTLLAAVRAAGVARRWRAAVAVFIGIASATTIVLLIVGLTTNADLSAFEPDRVSPIWLVIAIVTPIAVVMRLLKHRRITAGTLHGAISAYLLIAVAFAYGFLFVDGLQEKPFFVTEAEPSSTSFMYFSLVTVTTLGYGDLTASTAFTRLMATTEAVIGQVYLVTFVALLMGLLIQQRDGGSSPNRSDSQT